MEGPRGDKYTLKQRKNEGIYRNDSGRGPAYLYESQIIKWGDRFFIPTGETVEGAPGQSFPVYFNVLKNDPIMTVSVGAGRYIKADNNGQPDFIRYDDRRRLADYIKAEEETGIIGYFANKPVYSAPDGTLYAEADPPTTTIGGREYPHVIRLRRNTTKKGGFGKLGDGWKVGDQIKKSEEEIEGVQYKEKANNETDLIAEERAENRANQKKDLEQANQQLGKYSQLVDQTLGGGAMSYADRAKQSAREYAEQRARQDAARTAEINRQQAQTNARNAGLSGANAALMGNSQNLKAYTDQYSSTLNAQEQSHLNEQRAGLGAITGQQQFAQSQKSEANSRLEQDRDEGRQERDFAVSEEGKLYEQAKDKVNRILNGTNSIMGLLQGLGGIISEFSNIKAPAAGGAAPAGGDGTPAA